MKANTISIRRTGLSSPKSACLSATLIERFDATASASTEGSSISPNWMPVSGGSRLLSFA